SIGEISSKISPRPEISETSVRPAFFASARRAFQSSFPTSHPNDSVCRASRSGTVSVSEILANERRDTPRPFFLVVDVDALGAAAKGVTSVSPGRAGRFLDGGVCARELNDCRPPYEGTEKRAQLLTICRESRH